ncbi:MAG: DUF6197 family protein [Halobacteriota archaeon]
MKNSEILIAARAKLDTPEKWTQGACWRDAQGNEPEQPDTAVCFCTFGAVEAVTDEGYMAHSFLDTVVEGVASSIDYNDTLGRKHEEILDMFDKAIALAKQEENENV